jgi:general secretion pathway protein I
MNRMRSPSCGGFTLIEMLVALAILAIALAAVQRAVSGSLDNAFELKQRLLASWVADNRLAELRALRVCRPPARRAAKKPRPASYFTGKARSATRPIRYVERVEIRVTAAAESEHALAVLVGYLVKR